MAPRSASRKSLRWFAAAISTLCASIVAVPALAQERPLTVRAGVSEAWDSNLFRLPSSLDVQADRWTTAFIGLSLDKQYSQQELRLNVTQSAVRYNKFSYLNFNPFEYDGAWSWHLSPHLSGTLTGVRTQALNNYADYRNPSLRNLRTSNNWALNLDGWISGGWHLLGGATYDKVTNSQTFVQQGSYRANGANAGIKYVAASGSYVSLVHSRYNAQYPDQPLDPVLLLDTGYIQDYSELLASWILTGKSTLIGRVGWIDRRNDNFSQRDYSGAVGGLTYQWALSDQLRLDVLASRDLVVWTDSFASYTVNDRIALAPTWQISAKTSVHANVGYTSVDFRGPVVPLAGPQRHDHITDALVGASWSPLRSLTLTASFAYQHRNSTDAFQQYDDRIGTIGAALQF